MVVMERGFIMISYNEASGTVSFSVAPENELNELVVKAVGHQNRFWAACKRGDLNLASLICRSAFSGTPSAGKLEVPFCGPALAVAGLALYFPPPRIFEIHILV